MPIEIPASITTETWPLHAHNALQSLPPLVIPPPEASTTRMYAYFGSRAWASRNLLWFENAFAALRDAHYDLSHAAASAAEGFPTPDPKRILVPGNSLLLSLQNVPEPSEPLMDLNLIARAERFRYFLDNAATRTSVSFDSAFGLLSSYYRVRSLDLGATLKRSEIFARMSAEFPATRRYIEQLSAITISPAYKQGESYRNKRIHDVGTSLRALYGHGVELGEIVVLRAGMVGMKPAEHVPADQQLQTVASFYGLAKQFLQMLSKMIDDHPRYSEAIRFAPDPIVYGPVFHKRRDGDNFLDITDQFSRDDDAVHCSFVVNGCLNRIVGIRFSGPGWDDRFDVVIDSATEKRISFAQFRDSDKAFQTGQGRVTISLDRQPMVRRKFVIV